MARKFLLKNPFSLNSSYIVPYFSIHASDSSSVVVFLLMKTKTKIGNIINHNPVIIAQIVAMPMATDTRLGFRACKNVAKHKSI